MFFGLSLGIASIGAGNIATAALIAPLAMAVADRAKISPLLMTLDGGARLHCRGSFTDRPDGNHRQWLDGPHGHVGIRAAKLSL